MDAIYTHFEIYEHTHFVEINCIWNSTTENIINHKCFEYRAMNVYCIYILNNALY